MKDAKQTPTMAIIIDSDVATKTRDRIPVTMARRSRKLKKKFKKIKNLYPIAVTNRKKMPKKNFYSKAQKKIEL